VGVVSLGSLGIVNLALPLAHAQPSPRPPNIILILTDDLGYGDLGTYGQNARLRAGKSAIRTPNLDRIASTGMRFKNFYAGNTVCKPARLSLLTGYHTGHTVTNGNFPEYSIRDQDITIAELLKSAGFSTAAFGKWGVDDTNEVNGVPTAFGQIASGRGIPTQQGFEKFFGYLTTEAAHYSYPNQLLQLEGWRLWQSEGTNVKAINAGTEYTQDQFTRAALNFIESKKGVPFFLYLPYTISHANSAQNRLEVPQIEPEYINKTWPDTEKKYASMITRMDKQIGQILAKLVALGIENNTVILFTSDNGPHQAGRHNPEFFDSNGAFRGIKRDLYEGGIRVPMIVRWFGKISAGVVSQRVWSHYDVLPTITDIAGLPTPSGIDGISNLPTLQGETQTNQHRYFYWEFLENSIFKQAVRMKTAAGHIWKGVQINDTFELYDLSLDPSERNNVASQHPSTVTELKQIMLDNHPNLNPSQTQSPS
jgi:arylsulfatase A-like enzyme